MKRLATVMVAVAMLALAACSGGPTVEEKAEFARFAVERQADYPAAVLASFPVSIKDYALGRKGVEPAEYIVTGAFKDGDMLPPGSDPKDPTAFTVIGHFVLHKSMKGNVPSTFDVDLGDVHQVYLAKNIVRGLGDCVLFLNYDATNDRYVLVDGKYAVAQSDKGDLSMPLVPGAKQPVYMAGIVDTADVQGMLIAGGLDKHGTLNGGTDNLGNDGTTDTEQNLIDKANNSGG